jgi:hypothetical protein
VPLTWLAFLIEVLLHSRPEATLDSHAFALHPTEGSNVRSDGRSQCLIVCERPLLENNSMVILSIREPIVADKQFLILTYCLLPDTIRHTGVV